jgi:hypothetical protein
MAPEQANGRVDEIDHRTDQWALACIAWEMLAGRKPFNADSLPVLLVQITQQPPPALSLLTPGLPPEVEQVLRRALSKKRSERFASVSAFARALEAASVAPAPAPAPAPTSANTTSRVLVGSVTRSIERAAAARVGLRARVGQGLSQLRQRLRPRRRALVVRPVATIARLMTGLVRRPAPERWWGKRRRTRARLVWMLPALAAAALLAAVAMAFGLG